MIRKEKEWQKERERELGIDRERAILLPIQLGGIDVTQPLG